MTFELPRQAAPKQEGNVPTSPILLVGGATESDPGEVVTGSATDNSQTDAYDAYGYNNVVIENGGNLIVTPGTAPIDLHLGLTVTPYTTIELGNAIGVSDMITLAGPDDAVLQTKTTSLTGSTVVVRETEVFGPANTTVSLLNTGGTNEAFLYETDNIVTLTGAVNQVVSGASSTITVNGNASNSVDTTYAGESGVSQIAIGGAHDGFFGFTSSVLIAPADTITAGDENVFVGNLPYSSGYNLVTLGDGNSSVELFGQENRIVVGGGNDTIYAGGGADIVTILGFDGIDSANPPGKAKTHNNAVPISPNDTITLAGADNIVSATYENVTILGTAAAGDSAITLGNGTDTISLAGDSNVITLGDNTNTITLSGDLNRVGVSAGRATAFDTVVLGAGTGDVIALDAAGGLIIGTGSGSTTITQTASSNGAVTVELGEGRGAIVLGNGANTITAGDGSDQTPATIQVGNGRNNITVGSYATISLGGGKDTVAGGSDVSVTGGSGNDTVTVADHAQVTLGNGKDAVSAGDDCSVTLGSGGAAVSTGANASVSAGAGNDSIALGDHSLAIVTGNAISKVAATLSNASVAGFIGGRIAIHAASNDAVYSDEAISGSTVTFTDKGDLVFFGSNGSAKTFLNPDGGDVVGVRAIDATGTYAGTVDIANIAGNILHLEGLAGGIKAEPLMSYSAVLDNVTRSGAQQILHLSGGGEIAFGGHVNLTPGNFQFTNQFGPVVPGGL